MRRWPKIGSSQPVPTQSLVEQNEILRISFQRIRAPHRRQACG